MRVIHIVPAIAEEASGPSYSVVRLCESLIAQGQEECHEGQTRLIVHFKV